MVVPEQRLRMGAYVCASSLTPDNLASQLFETGVKFFLEEFIWEHQCDL